MACSCCGGSTTMQSLVGDRRDRVPRLNHEALTVCCAPTSGRHGHRPQAALTVRAVLRDGAPYRDPEVDYESLVVKGNASRWLAAVAEFGILVAARRRTMAVNWANA